MATGNVGETPFTLAEPAAEVSRHANKPIVHRDLSPIAYATSCPAPAFRLLSPKMLVDADLGLSRGELDSGSTDLRNLIGGPTTPLADAVCAALQ